MVGAGSFEDFVKRPPTPRRLFRARPRYTLLMRRLALLAVLTSSVCSFGQTLGDVARANREKPKSTTSKVITNDELKSSRTESPSSDPSVELENMRQILRLICADPRTRNGRRLSDFDKREITEGVKPLLARIEQYQRVQKKYKDAMEALDREFEADVMKASKNKRALTEKDIRQIKAMREDYEARRVALIKEGEGELKGFPVFQKELESVGKECPAAAKMVPD